MYLPDVVAQLGHLVERLIAAGTLEAYLVVYALFVSFHGERLREELTADVTLPARCQLTVSLTSHCHTMCHITVYAGHQL